MQANVENFVLLEYEHENDIEKANKGYLLAVTLNAGTGTGTPDFSSNDDVVDGDFKEV